MRVDIVLVEDNHDDAELAMRVLRQDNPGVKVLHLTDGSEALNYFFGGGGNLPKVIFLDIKLPKLTGPEVLKRLKADELTRSVPVVVMTSSGQQRDIRECYELGVNSYLVKPIDFKKYKTMLVATSRYWLHFNLTTPF